MPDYAASGHGLEASARGQCLQVSDSLKDCQHQLFQLMQHFWSAFLTPDISGHELNAACIKIFKLKVKSVTCSSYEEKKILIRGIYISVAYSVGTYLCCAFLAPCVGWFFALSSHGTAGAALKCKIIINIIIYWSSKLHHQNTDFILSGKEFRNF